MTDAHQIDTLAIEPGLPLHAVVGCVADMMPKYLDQALRLLQSWRWFAGSLASADFRICVTGELDNRYRQDFERYDASVHVVDRFTPHHPQSNKLRFLELPDVRDADRVVLMDCDTVVVQEPVALFDDSADFAAKLADMPTVSLATFATLFEAFGLSLPPAAYRCTVHQEPTIPYFNAGVLAFSRRAMATLVPEWIRLNHVLANRLELLGESSNFCEQASLSLALASCPTAFRTLGPEMNFPTHMFLDEPLASAFANTDPAIIHYHWHIEPDGSLGASPYRSVDRRVRQFNARLQSARSNDRPNERPASG